MALVPVVCCILGIAGHFVITFKGEAILPSDILALGTAMEVSEGYEFTFTAGIVTSLALLEISLGLLSLIRPRKLRTPTHIFPAIAANLCAFLLVTVVGLSGFSSIDLERALNFGFDRWQPITTYTSQGFITSFTEMVNELPIEKPEDYTPDEAQSIEQELAAAYDSTYGSSEQRAAAVAQFNEIKPTIVAVMNESFSDLSCFEQLQAAGYTGPAFYNSLPDTLVRGTMLASVTGGGTANSEFEFLTGATTAFVGLGKIPYQLYQMNGVNSLAKDLKELGYTATAMHPQNPVNYHRDKIYQQLGFGDFLSIGDFEGAPCYHAGVCDYATYDKILDLLRTDEAPQFIFDVTMQNHGGYDYGTVPAEELTNYWVEGASEGANSALNTYLTCINASDRDLEYFINELRNIGRPVVLVFFGDHQPSAATTLNDELYPQEDTASHAFRIYQSTYFVWANYEIAGNTELNVYDTVGANEIAAITLNKIGAPLTDYQKALLATRSDVPTINVAGYLGADGLRYDLASEDSPYASTVDKLLRMQYLEFASSSVSPPIRLGPSYCKHVWPKCIAMTPARNRYNDARVHHGLRPQHIQGSYMGCEHAQAGGQTSPRFWEHAVQVKRVIAVLSGKEGGKCLSPAHATELARHGHKVGVRCRHHRSLYPQDVQYERRHVHAMATLCCPKSPSTASRSELQPCSKTTDPVLWRSGHRRRH
ncbi:MAG: sulfatase-like hydrolase/transferase [Collinsella aerofaciens]